MALTMEIKPWQGWDNCCWYSNNDVALIITTDVGPRVLYYARHGGQNLLNNYQPDMGETGDSEFRLYGGHRFWHAPEHMPRTYHPDNHPVQVEQRGDMIRLTAPEETENGVQKILEIRLEERGSNVEVRHRLVNTGRWPIQVAPWALTVMAPGGRAILPLPPRAAHPEALLPVNNLTMWAYTDLSDQRWTLSKRYIMLQQQGGENVTPQKIGASVPDGWLAYILGNTAFIKQFDYQPGPYPDMNSSVELFTNSWMLECETLGHLSLLAPGDEVEHVEYWTLFSGVSMPTSDDEVDDIILPLLN